MCVSVCLQDLFGDQLFEKSVSPVLMTVMSAALQGVQGKEVSDLLFEQSASPIVVRNVLAALQRVQGKRDFGETMAVRFSQSSSMVLTTLIATVVMMLPLSYSRRLADSEFQTLIAVVMMLPSVRLLAKISGFPVSNADKATPFFFYVSRHLIRMKSMREGEKNKKAIQKNTVY